LFDELAQLMVVGEQQHRDPAAVNAHPTPCIVPTDTQHARRVTKGDPGLQPLELRAVTSNQEFQTGLTLAQHHAKVVASSISESLRSSVLAQAGQQISQVELGAAA
jgi:hypothetical protein